MTAAGQTLEAVIGYEFGNRKLLDRALTHRSWISEQIGEKRDDGDNEQLEFLGDSLLGFIVSEALFLAHPGMSEGQLSQSKAQLVCTTHLYVCATELGLGNFLHLGRGEERNGGRERRTLLANAVEAIIAAIFLDGGIVPAQEFIRRHVVPDIASSSNVAALTLLDHKGVLQEQAQSRGLPPPRYVVAATSGPEHSKRFTVEVRVGDHFASRAEGSSKKAASQLAAQLLMQELTASGWKSPLPDEPDSAGDAAESHAIPPVAVAAQTAVGE